MQAGIGSGREGPPTPSLEPGVYASRLASVNRAICLRPAGRRGGLKLPLLRDGRCQAASGARLGGFVECDALFNEVFDPLGILTADESSQPPARGRPAIHQKLGNQPTSGQLLPKLPLAVEIDHGERNSLEQAPLLDFRDYRFLHLAAGRTPIGANHDDQRTPGFGGHSAGFGIGVARLGGSERYLQDGDEADAGHECLLLGTEESRQESFGGSTPAFSRAVCPDRSGSYKQTVLATRCDRAMRG